MRARRLVGLVVLIALFAAAPALAATSATGIQVQGGGCAPLGGWTLWTVSDLLDYLGLTEVPPSMDGNDDGLTCVRFQILANGRKGWTAVIWADNDVR